MNNFTDCPVCGSKDLKRVTGTETFTYKCHETHIENYTVYYCDKCGESFADLESRQRGEQILKSSIGSFKNEN